jgi:hypothetical protein
MLQSKVQCYRVTHIIVESNARGVTAYYEVEQKFVQRSKFQFFMCVLILSCNSI